jgi:hypothetical protein
MKTDQIDLVTSPVSRNVKQFLHAGKSGFTREIVADVLERDLGDRIDDDMAVVHSIPVADFHARARPDANSASDASSANTLAKVLSELHRSFFQLKAKLPTAGV